MSRLVVIGSGPGGYVAAIRAAQLGLDVTLVEKDRLGGVCLNWGCIPTKALLRSAEISLLSSHLSEFGFQGEVRSYWDSIVKRSRSIAEGLSKNVAGLIQKNKIKLIQGHARLKEKRGTCWVTSVESLEGTQDVESENVLLATGARARLLPGWENTSALWTYKEAMIPSHVPPVLIVVGAGAIGLEFANIFQALGSKVHVVEQSTNVLPQEDAETVKIAVQAWKKRGIQFHLGCTAFIDSDLSQNNKGEQEKTSVTIKNLSTNATEVILADKVLLAVGIVPNVQDLGLERTAVRYDARGHIQVNPVTYQTQEDGIYAIGDVTGAPWLAHKASHEGVRAVEGIARNAKLHHQDIKHTLDSAEEPSVLSPEVVPGCIYTVPQIASLGLTEEKAKEQGIPVRVGRYPFRGNGKALALGETTGLIKVLFHKETGGFLGAHLVGPDVTELIHSFVLAQRLEATELDFLESVFPHPTLSESLHEAVLEAYGIAIHY